MTFRDELIDRVACEVCGPLPPPNVHDTCHDHPSGRPGCGHALKDHSDGLKCRVCKRECGIHCRGQHDLS